MPYTRYIVIQFKVMVIEFPWELVVSWMLASRLHDDIPFESELYYYYIFIITNSVSTYLSVLRAASMVNPFSWPTNLRDIIRETSRRCSTVIHGIYIYYFIILMLSESVLFMVLF